MKRHILPAIVAVGLAISLTACGSSSAHHTAAAGKSSGGIDATACKGEIGKFVDDLKQIDSRLDIGLNVSELGDKLGDAKVDYDALDVDAVVKDCGTEVGANAEQAFNAYVSSLNAWQNCIESDYCDTDSMPTVQKKWAKASELLTTIDDKLG